MPDLVLVLAVLIASLAAVGAVALTLAHRSLRPAFQVGVASGSNLLLARLAVRSAARRGVVAWVTSVGVLVAVMWIANSLFRDAIGDGVFAAPILGGAAGIGLYGLLQSRPLLARPALAASLDPRRAGGFAPTRSFIAVGVLVALLLAIVAFAAISEPAAATFVGPKLLALLAFIGALAAAVMFALRRIAERAALPEQLSEADLAIRQIATRFVLLLAMSALLGPVALVGLQSGVWLWGFAAVATESADVDTLVGATVALVGALAAVGSVGSFTAIVLATGKHLRAGSQVLVVSAAVSA